MVDVISHNGIDEFEDGELPEDGEICDDEEEVPQSKPEPQQAQPSTSDTSSSSSSSHRDRERERERPRERRSRRNEEQVDPFGPDQQNGETYPVTNGDKDYRSIEEDYSDIDYRVSRRRRHSPPNNNDHHHHHNHHHAKRPPNPYYNSRPASYRGGLHGAASRSSASSSTSTSDQNIVPRFNTEKQICKFFREGYCRDGDDGCAYSHNTEDSLRRPILCNFYANSYCKKGLQCLMLHGEFPCREFHQNGGKCANEQCKYSHLPLTEYTQPLYEASLKDDHPMSRYHRVAAPPAVVAPLPTSRRKVLLPGGPPIAAKMSPPMIHAAIPPNNGGQLAPPSVVVPTRSGAGYPTTGYFNQGPQAAVPGGGLPPVRNIEPPKPVALMGMQQQATPATTPAPQPAFNIEAMLNKLAKGGDLSEDESPASPPPPTLPLPLFSHSPTRIIAGDNDAAAVARPASPPQWRLIRVRREPPYTGVANCENIAANDPRKARCISAQFDAISSLLSGEATSHVAEDPRLAANSDKTPFSPVITSSWMPQMS